MAQVRRPASRLLFSLGCVLWGGALAMLFAAYLLPSEGMQDLGRIVGAMLIAAVSVPVFLLALLLGRGTRMPSWMMGVSAAGAILGAVPAIVLAATRF